MGNPSRLLDTICGLVILLAIPIYHHRCLPEGRLAKSAERWPRNSSTTLAPSNARAGNSAKVLQLTNTTSRSNTRTFSAPQIRQDVGSSREMLTQQGDTRVPLWNIAHMINSIEQIEPALRLGANGIEVDISFDKRGYPMESYHGFPCDCGRHCHHREDFVKFVSHLGELSAAAAELETTFNRLQLVLLDLKLKDLDAQQKEAAGRYLASLLEENLYSKFRDSAEIARRKDRYFIGQPPVRVVISINHVTDQMLVRSFMEEVHSNHWDFMSRHVGFDVGMNDDLREISSMWDNFGGISFNIWQGDGLTNCANIVRGVDRLKEAISIRNGQGHFRKIYYWTADILYQIRSVLRLGLDAVLTNQPQRVVQVIEEPEFRTRYRLATPFDDPFAQFWIQPSAWKMSPPSIGEAVETVTNIRETSANFVKTIPEGLAAALEKVHHAIG